MLHEARINFRRRIVNQTRRVSCRAAAQFNPAHSLDGGTPVLFHTAPAWPAASDEHRSATATLLI